MPVIASSEERQARADIADLCDRLMKRGDRDSLEAVATLIGTLEAFAAVAEKARAAQEQFDRVWENFETLRHLWGRLPANVRMSLDPMAFSQVAPPPMVVVHKGWLRDRVTERSAADLAKEDRDRHA